MRSRFPAALLWLCFALAPSGAVDDLPVPAEIASPAPVGSSAPQLASDLDGRVILSWLEPAGSGRHRFAFSVRERGRWTAPRTIAEETRMFANWADVPAVVALPDGTWAAHWLSSTGRGSYDVKVSTSADRGRTWSTPVVPHRDGTKTEHGFASLGPWPTGSLGMIWLDGRNYAAHGAHSMKGHTELRATVFERGQPGAEVLVDGRVCDCCPTAITRTDRGLVAAYRDRSDDEIRDIHVVRFENGRWLAPAAVHADGWKIAGCPVNGPAIASRGSRVAVAWFSAAADLPRVNVAVSADGGATFASPVRIDDGFPEGRVAVAMVESGEILTTWIERARSGWEVRMRRMDAGGQTSASVRVARISADRSSGYPRMTATPTGVVFAWVDGGVRTAHALESPTREPENPRTREPENPRTFCYYLGRYGASRPGSPLNRET